MLIQETGAALHIEPLPCADNRVEGKPRIFARQQLDDVHAELIGAFVQEGEVKILSALLVLEVFGDPTPTAPAISSG